MTSGIGIRDRALDRSLKRQRTNRSGSFFSSRGGILLPQVSPRAAKTRYGAKAALCFILLGACAPLASAGTDLEVLYIERTPKYPKCDP